MIKFVEIIQGENVIIFPGCVLGRPPMAPAGVTQINYELLPEKPVYIGTNSVIGANTVIYNNVRIGSNCLIGDGVHIREDVIIGNNCIVGIGCKIGARTYIADNVRIMDLTNVASDAVLEHHVFIGPGVMMGNDNGMGRADKVNGFDYNGPKICEWVTVGMNSTILPGIVVERDSLIAAGSVVTKNVKAYSVMMGVPAVLKRVLGEEERRCK